GTDGRALLDQTKAIFAQDANKGLPADLIEAAKRHEVASAEFEKNSIEGLASAWSQALAVEGRHSPDDDVQAIANVTKADVDRLAKQILDPQTAFTVNLIPRSSGKLASGHTFGGGENFGSANPKPAKLPRWAQDTLWDMKVPPMPVKPVDMQLPNGMRVIFVPNHASRAVLVEGVVKSDSDLETPRGKEGVAGVLDDLFSYGTTTLDRIAYQKALDDIGAVESAGTSFSLQVLAPQFDRGMALLADNLLHPALPAASFKVVQQEHAQAAAGTLQSPQYLASRALTKAIVPPGDPRLRQATPRSISRLTLADVKAYYQGAFRPDLTTIVIIGDLTPGQAKAAASQYFGNWAAWGPPPETLAPPIPLHSKVAVTVPDSSRVQDKVTLGMNLELNRWDPDYYALQLGNTVLGGAFNSTRLYKDLRMNGGLVYYVFPVFRVGLTRTYYEFEFGCDPQNVSKARDILERDVSQMRAGPVSARELRQAKAQLLRDIPLSQASVDAIASGYLQRCLLSLPLDEPQRAARRYLQLKASDIQRAFHRWVEPGHLSQVVLGPDPR
ncbi:MAG: insulinase family protein, partial [Cyanobacteria bacterium REEB65]|nr:insulinase family protein [Cyanobacteria bacterium REEB65]